MPRQRQDVFDDLLGQDRHSGGNAADERNLDGLRRGADRGIGAVGGLAAPDAVGAGAVRVPVEHTFAFQRHELVRDGGGAPEVDALADLPHRGRVALAGHGLLDEGDDGGLAGGESVRARAGDTGRAPRAGFGFDDVHVVLPPEGILRAGTVTRSPPDTEHLFDNRAYRSRSGW